MEGRTDCRRALDRIGPIKHINNSTAVMGGDRTHLSPTAGQAGLINSCLLHLASVYDSQKVVLTFVCALVLVVHVFGDSEIGIDVRPEYVDWRGFT
jgi:hypothetical protein